MISVAILVKNNPRHIKKVLDSTKSFDEVVILDSGATTAVLEIINQYPNVSVHRAKIKGLGGIIHNEAASVAKNDWILAIDADEVIDPKLAKNILALDLNESCVYSFPFQNYYRGQFIKGCGWYPDRHVRLYNRKKTAFNENLVHEKIIDKGFRIIHLNAPIHHYSYENISDFIAKMQHYSSLFAEQNQHKKKSSVFKAITHGLFGFIKSYIIKKGFSDGFAGFMISIYNAHTAFYKYLKLYERNNASNTDVP